MFGKKIYIMIVAIVFGILLITQLRSFLQINDVFLRETQSNIFQEIKILKDKNADLREEIDKLELNLNQINDQNAVLEVLEKEINEYKKLNGKYPIFGAGASITIESKLTTPWVVDLINEFYNAGAQAVSINDIRLTNKALGFDTLPQDQILLNGVILSSPYVFNIIGDSSVIIDALESPGGIFDRMEASFKDIVIKIDKKEVIQMN